MSAWVKRTATVLAVAGMVGGAFWKGMANEAARFSRFVEASVAVYGLVKDTPQGKELKAAYDELWIAGKVKAVLPAAQSDAAPTMARVAGESPCPTPVDIDTLRNMIGAGKEAAR